MPNYLPYESKIGKIVLCDTTKKRTYKSRAKAVKSSRLTTIRPKLHPYICDHCGSWHLTKIRQNVKT